MKVEIDSKVKVVAEPYAALPCTLQVFTINGIDADEGDFGESIDSEPETAEEYGCGCRVFNADRIEKSDILKKYNINYEEYLTICDLLEEVLLVGRCGWCV